MKRLAVIVAIISALAAFLCLTVNVDTKNIGGITGTLIVPLETPKENIDRTRLFLRIAGFGWICIGILSISCATRTSKR